jgi:hypothetical protein
MMMMSAGIRIAKLDCRNKLILYMDQREQNRLKRLANLKPFSSEYQPRNRRSRKGIPNRSTILKQAMEEFERREKIKQAKGTVRCPSCRFRFKPKARKEPKKEEVNWRSSLNSGE